jgi:hypothetical protein
MVLRAMVMPASHFKDFFIDQVCYGIRELVDHYS